MLIWDLIEKFQILEELQDMRKQMKTLQEKNNGFMQQTMSMEEVLSTYFWKDSLGFTGRLKNSR